MHEGLLKNPATPDKIRRVTPEQRRNQGIYYTPVAIARYMARKSINALVSDGTDSIKSISVLDPACGEGVFIVESARYIKEILPKTMDSRFLASNLHGIDIDAEALQKARDALNLILNSVSTHLIEKNALFDEIITDSKHDLVIGNPPYIPWHRIPRDERALLENGEYLDTRFACRPNHADAQPNYYLFFIVRAAALLKPRGIISFLLPQEWLYHERVKDFRNYMLDHFGKIDITVFKFDEKFFKERGATAGTTSLILTLHKCGNSVLAMRVFDTRIDEISMDAIDDRAVLEIPFEKARDVPWTFLDPEREAMKNLILSQDVAFFNDAAYFEVKGGFQPPIIAAKLFEIDEDRYRSLPAKERDYVFPLVHDAREIKPYIISLRSNRFWIIANDFESESRFFGECPALHALLKSRLDASRSRWWCFPNIRNFGLIQASSEKILAPRTSATPSFAFDDQHSVFKGTNTMIVSKQMPARYVLGILNSKLSAFWQENLGFQYHGSATRKNEPSKAKKTLIPIKKVDRENRNKIINLVDRMLDALAKKNDYDPKEIKAIQTCIDAAVFHLYGIDENVLVTINKDNLRKDC